MLLLLLPTIILFRNYLPLAPAEIDQAQDQAERMRRPRNAPDRLEYERPGGPNQRNRSHTAGLYSCGAACTNKAFVSHAEAEGYQNTPLRRIDLDNHYVQGFTWEEIVVSQGQIFQ